MKIGIVVFSYTGNTLSVANSLKERLMAQGHQAEIERIAPVDFNPRERKEITFKTLPEIAGYDAIIFGAPVMAFNLNPVMKAYLKQVSRLDKKILCYITMSFPYAWMGGKNAISKMKTAIATAGGKVEGEGIINWSRKSRNKMIEDMVDGFSRVF